MYILLTNRPGGAFGFISESWINCLRAAGHICERWNGQKSTWEQFNPDLYIGCSGHRQDVPSVVDRGKCKIAIHVNPYCDITINGINETKEAIAWVLSKRPNVVFGYGHETDRELWHNWSRHGVYWVPMPTAGDSVVYGHEVLERDIDIVYVGGRWGYKSSCLDKYLLPLLKDTELKIKLIGWGEWQVPVERDVADDVIPSLFARSKVCPCVSEPHTIKYGIDLPERLWKVSLSGSLVIHDQALRIERYMPSALVSSDPTQYARLCKYYCQDENQQERKEIARRQLLDVLNGNTYFHRMATLFTAIGKEIGEAADCSDGFAVEASRLLQVGNGISQDILTKNGLNK